MSATRERLTCAETAKLVRKALRAAFPGQKFSVRSSNYSMGASIDVYWQDGPTQRQVETVAQRYEGATFDGMIDLKSYHTTLLADEDGGVREVRLAADFVMCHRRLSPEQREHTAAEVAEFLRETGQGELDTTDWRKHYPGTALLRSPGSEEMRLCLSDGGGGNGIGFNCNGAQLVEYLGLSRELPRSKVLPR